MSALEGFEVYERPGKRYSPMRDKWDEIVREFLETGNACMGKRYFDMGELKRDRYAARLVCAEIGGVKVSKRGDVLMLVREKV